jgi:crotonobetainyl-CoA:carnitine CoA-transferase CaiB-like acyl-CoA transferase
MGDLPLAGIRVLDASGPIGAYASRLLTLLGADVVCVEPRHGDALRSSPPFLPDGRAGMAYAYYHGGQRSLVLDDASDDAARALGLAAETADVVLVAPASRPVPGYDERSRSFAWTPDDAIVCAITPFGLTGPYRWWRATPLVSFAMSGGMIRIGPPEGPPVAEPGRMAWDEAGTHAVLCILAALLARVDAGGQLIDLAVHDVLSAKDFHVETYSVSGQTVGGRDVPVGYPPTGTWACADGSIEIAAHQAAHWDAFLETLGHPEDLSDPSLADVLVRREVFDGLIEVIDRILAGERREELVHRGQLAGLPCAVCNTPGEFLRDAQLTARHSLVRVRDADLGEITMPGTPVVTSPPLFRCDHPAPRIGEGGDAGWSGERVPVARFARPLDGLRVLSFGSFVAGNTAALPLAELGADVVKIEPRARPEVLRSAGYAYGRYVSEPSGVTNTALYGSLSRSTRSLSLEMHTDAGRSLFRRLVAEAHVVIENFGTATQMADWACSFEDLVGVNPTIVMLSLSGYGRSGPRGAYRAYASSIAGFVGLSSLWGFSHGTLTDYLCSAHGVVAVLAALAHAARDGEGVRIDAAQIETAAAVMGPLLLESLVTGHDTGPSDNDVAGSVLAGVYQCAGDDRWVAVELEDLDDWRALCKLLERPELVPTTDAEARERRAALDTALAEFAALRTPHTVAHLLQQRGLAAGAVQTNEDLSRDPSLRERGMVVEIDHPDLGIIEHAQSPYRMSATPGFVRRPGPRLGQHTREVLEEWLALPPDEIALYEGAGAIFIPPGSLVDSAPPSGFVSY